MSTRKKKSRKYSSADNIYKSLFGVYPTKAGKALEVLSTAAYAIATKSGDSELDLYLHGKSGAREQIDGRLFVNEDEVFLEAKDYSRPIGVGKIRDFEGMITDFEANRGVFAAESFSKDARLYAKGTNTNPNHKKVTLLDVRGFRKEDLIGRITGFKMQIQVPPMPDMDSLDWICEFSMETSLEIIESGIDSDKENSIRIVDVNGSEVELDTVFFNDAYRIIKERQLKNGDSISSEISGAGKFAVMSNGKSYPIKRFTYSVKVFAYDKTTLVKANGEPVFLIECDEEKINKLITDTDLIKWGKQHNFYKKKT